MPCKVSSSGNEKIKSVIIDRKKTLFLLTLLSIMLTVLSPTSAWAFGSKAAEQAGAALFRDKGCAYCHGANTQGTAKGPSLIDVRKKLHAPEIIKQIEDGGQKMPSFSDSLSKDQVAQLVAYLRAKHRPVPPPVPPTPVSSAVCNRGQQASKVPATISLALNR